MTPTFLRQLGPRPMGVTVRFKVEDDGDARGSAAFIVLPLTDELLAIEPGANIRAYRHSNVAWWGRTQSEVRQSNVISGFSC